MPPPNILSISSSEDDEELEEDEELEDDDEVVVVSEEPSISQMVVEQPLERYDSRTRRRTRPAKRTNWQHGWEQPASHFTPSALNSNDKVLHGIVYCLVRLNLGMLETATAATDRRDQSLFGWNDHDHIKNLLNREPLGSHPTGSYDGHEPQEFKIREFVDTLNRDQVEYYIQDLGLLHYLSRLFEQRVNLCQMAEARKRIVEASPDFTVASDLIEQFGEDYSKNQYAEYCVIEHRGARIALRLVYNIVIDLRVYISQAVSQGLLDKSSLERLKSKMSTIQEHFHETCHELGRPIQNLVSNTESWWSDGPGNEFQDREPKNMAHAYQKSPNATSTLAFIVPVLSLISSIPVFLAYTHSAHQAGSTSDADFYQLISGSSMQLLSILILDIPTVSNARLVTMAWFWTWVLAGASTICAIVAIPLYLYVPTEWSAIVSFVGSIAQGFVTLQLMFTLLT